MDDDRPALSPRAKQLKEELLGEFSLTVDDVAGILEVDRSTVYRYIQDGALAALKIGREYRLSEVDVKGFLEALIQRERERVGELRVKALMVAPAAPAAPEAPRAPQPSAAAKAPMARAKAAPGSVEEPGPDEPGPYTGRDSEWGEMVIAVVSQAWAEAKARGHAETHPGHLLLALASEAPYRRWGSPFREMARLGDGLARRALDALGADLPAIRQAAEATLPAPSLPANEGKEDRRHTPELREWFNGFSPAARALRRPWVGTDAVLFAAFDLPPLAEALNAGGVGREAVEAELRRLAPLLAPAPKPPYAERARLVAHMALDRAMQAKRGVATPEDLLASLLSDQSTAREGIARQVLDEVGADLAAIRQAAEAATPPTGPAEPERGDRRVADSTGAQPLPPPGPAEPERGDRDPEPNPALRTIVRERAVAAAKGLGHAEVGTEHLLLGLYSVSELADILEAAGAPHAAVRAAIRRRLPPNAPQPEERRPLFARYSERSQRVIVRAQDLARKGGIDYVSAVHLLVATLDQTGGLSERILQTLGVDIPALRQAAEALLPTGGGAAPGQQIQFTPDAKAVVMEHAINAARNLGHSYVGTEHLLLGLYGVERTAELLQSAGAPQEGVEAEALRILSGTDRPPATPKVPLDAAAQAAVAAATADVRRLGTIALHPGHLLLGLLADDPAVLGSAGRIILERLGVDAKALRAAVEPGLPKIGPRLETRDPIVRRLDPGGSAPAPGLHTPSGRIVFTRDASAVLHDRAPQAAQAHGASAVGTQHILQALYSVPDLAELLAAHGAASDAVDVEVGKG